MSTQQPDNALISEASKAQIQDWLAKYPPEQKRSALMPTLNIVQAQNGGWLSQAHLDAVADYLQLPAIWVYEMVKFYSLYELEPIGRYKIAVCNSISCHLCQSADIIKHLEKRLGIKMGKTTPDGKFTLREVECLAACRNAPMMQIGKTYHENLTPERVDDILNELE